MPDKIAQHIGNDLFSKLRNYREWNGITNENKNKRYKNMNRKNTIKLTESELKKIISESVKKVLKESMYDANDGFTSSTSYDIQKGNTQQSQVPQFKHVRELDQANIKAIVDLIKRVCTTKDGYFDADEYRLEQAFEKEYGMSSDEMEEKGIWKIVGDMIEIALEEGYLY